MGYFIFSLNIIRPFCDYSIVESIPYFRIVRDIIIT